ncbi:MAG: DUF2934 domain-containing protein [Acidobacteriota bacterium]
MNRVGEKSTVSSKQSTAKRFYTRSVSVTAEAPTPDEIRQRAYELYLARGAGPRHHLEDWLQAERELREARKRGA